MFSAGDFKVKLRIHAFAGLAMVGLAILSFITICAVTARADAFDCNYWLAQCAVYCGGFDGDDSTCINQAWCNDSNDNYCGCVSGGVCAEYRDGSCVPGSPCIPY